MGDCAKSSAHITRADGLSSTQQMERNLKFIVTIKILIGPAPSSASLLTIVYDCFLFAIIEKKVKTREMYEVK